MQLFKNKSILLRPARGGAAGVVLVFSVGLGLAIKAGFMGLPLAVLLVSWYFKYIGFLFDSVVRGVDEFPALDIRGMLNPFGELATVGAALVVVVMFFGLREADRYLCSGQPAAIAVGILAALALPASVAVLGLEENVFIGGITLAPSPAW